MHTDLNADGRPNELPQIASELCSGLLEMRFPTSLFSIFRKNIYNTWKKILILCFNG